jgi:hypothetical protein
MEVAKQRYVEAVHSCGPAFQENFFADHAWAHRLEENPIGSNGGNTRTCRQTEEFSPVNLPGGQTFLRCRLPENSHLLGYRKRVADRMTGTEPLAKN